MTKEQKLELIRRYAPILWLHEDDAFFPEDCAVMSQYAQIGKSDAEMRDFTLDELGDLDDSQDYYMNLPGIDFNNLGMNSGYEGPAMGPEGLSLYVRETYGNNTFLNPDARQPLPKFLARASKIRITYTRNLMNDFLRDNHPGIFGDYYVVQYYFFFIYNDSWNQHVSDWDSTMEIFAKQDNSQAYAIYNMHHTSWMVQLSGQPQALNNWIADWQDVENNRMGWCFQYGVHPFIFVARGAHGGYPTPGYSVHGGGALGKKMLAQTDYRQIGKLCVFPDYVPVSEEVIKNILEAANIDTDQLRFLSWEEPVILENQPWLKYKGLWGTKAEYEGWSGATGPKQKKCWRMNQRRFKGAFFEAVQGDYKSGLLVKILKNWHGWR